MPSPKPEPPPPGLKEDDVLRRMLAMPPDPRIGKPKKAKKKRLKSRG